MLTFKFQLHSNSEIRWPWVRTIWKYAIYETSSHCDVIEWEHFPRNWPFVREIDRSPVDSPHKGQWRGAFMFYLNCAWTNTSANNRDAGDLRCHRAHYDVIVMSYWLISCSITQNFYSLSGKTSYRKISKPQDSSLDFCTRSEIWQAAFKFQSHTIIITSNLAASRLHEICR